MYSILDELFYGNRGSAECVETSKEYKKQFNEYVELFNALRKELTEEQNEKLDELYDKEGALSSQDELMYFKEGFKIGLLIGIECTSK